MKHLVPLFLIALLAVALPFATVDPASAQGAVYVTPAAAADATDIINGRIVSTVSVDLDGDAHRVSEVEITGTEKGELSGSVLVEVPGGERADGTILFVSHTPELVPGALVQLALEPTPGTLGVGLGVAINPDLDVYSVVNGIDGASGLVSEDGGGALGVGDYSLTGVSWPDFAPPVVFKVNPANSGLSSSATIAGVQRAFQLWEDDLGSDIDFAYGGTTSKVGINLNDSQNTVSWVNSSASWLAQASWVAAGGGEILGFDIQVNRRYTWSNGAASGRYDIGTVVAHEVGHGIGFGHVGPSSELMNYQIQAGSSKPLGAGDKSGAAFLYPAIYHGPVCNGEPVTVNLGTGQGSATDGRDVILGTDGNDWIWGGGGDDLICGGLGVDRIYAGLGNDVVFGDGGSDRIYGQGGHDEIHGGSGADKIYGGTGSDKIFGNGGQDKIWGEDGNDEIQGNWESDKIWGGPGNDIVRGAGGKDKLYGEQGNDSLFGGLNTDYLNGGSGTDSGDGQQGADNPLIAGVSGCEQLAVITSC